MGITDIRLSGSYPVPITQFMAVRQSLFSAVPEIVRGATHFLKRKEFLLGVRVYQYLNSKGKFKFRGDKESRKVISFKKEEKEEEEETLDEI